MAAHGSTTPVYLTTPREEPKKAAFLLTTPREEPKKEDDVSFASALEILVKAHFNEVEDLARQLHALQSRPRPRLRRGASRTLSSASGHAPTLVSPPPMPSPRQHAPDPPADLPWPSLTGGRQLTPQSSVSRTISSLVAAQERSLWSSQGPSQMSMPEDAVPAQLPTSVVAARHSLASKLESDAQLGEPPVGSSGSRRPQRRTHPGPTLQVQYMSRGSEDDDEDVELRKQQQLRLHRPRKQTVYMVHACFGESHCNPEAIDLTGQSSLTYNNNNYNSKSKSYVSSPSSVQERQDRFMLHPQGSPRGMWGLCCLVFVLYDFVTLPMQVFEPTDGDKSQWVALVEWCGAIFWTLDISINFRTGRYAKDSALVMDWRAVGLRYVRTWFVLDVLLAIAAWLNVAPNLTSTALASTAMLRVFRLFRFARLLRALHTFRYLHRHVVKALNSANYIQLVTISSRLAALFFFNHIVACIWYWIGEASPDGWVESKRRELEAGEGENSYNFTLYWYFTSLHWSITQFIGSMEVVPKTDYERVYAVLVLLMALTICSTLISSITTMGAEVASKLREETAMREALRTFLHRYNIDKDLCVIVKREVDEHLRHKSRDMSQTKLFSFMPPGLRVRMLSEMRVNVIKKSWVFAMLVDERPKFINKVCGRAMDELVVDEGEFVFTVGDRCEASYWVLDGRFSYTPEIFYMQERGSSVYAAALQDIGNFPLPDPGRQPSSDGHSLAEWAETALVEHDQVSEAALWTTWHHSGELVCGQRGSSLLSISVARFLEITSISNAARAKLLPYAAYFVASMNTHGCSDLGLHDPQLKTGGFAKLRSHQKRQQMLVTMAPQLPGHRLLSPGSRASNTLSSVPVAGNALPGAG